MDLISRVRFEQFRVDLISRMGVKAAENGDFLPHMESFKWFLRPKWELKIFAVDLISRVSNPTRFRDFKFRENGNNSRNHEI